MWMLRVLLLPFLYLYDNGNAMFDELNEIFKSVVIVVAFLPLWNAFQMWHK